MKIALRFIILGLVSVSLTGCFEEAVVGKWRLTEGTAHFVEIEFQEDEGGFMFLPGGEKMQFVWEDMQNGTTMLKSDAAEVFCKITTESGQMSMTDCEYAGIYSRVK